MNHMAQQDRTGTAGTTTATGTVGTTTGTTTGTGTLGGTEQREGARITGTSHIGDTGGPGPELMSAGSLTGDSVINRKGETLGSIEDIMIDVRSGRIAYAVMGAGGFLGIGEKLFAIPWKALTLDTDNKAFILDVDKERVQNAPGFDKDHWPSMADLSWATNVHSYYGTRPYWE
jgi:sporulation protein YlmC with PRC-barrel domain